MTGPIPTDLLADTLSALEDLELPLLAWGVTESALAREEVLNAIAATLSARQGRRESPPGADDVLEALLEGTLLFRIPGSSPGRYRTRMAETVRLAAGLRQLWAPRGNQQAGYQALAVPRWWQRGAPLVADFRLIAQPRRYPRRDVGAESALRDIAPEGSLSEAELAVAAAQIGGWDLARFQVEASRLVLEAVSSGQSRGIIVSAGTGSGKTLAFYLPAYTAITAGLSDAGAGVQTMALYPRKELLKDQMREAIAAARTIRDVLRDHGRRPLRIGALYGDTPFDAHDLERDNERAKAWPQRRGGRTCPYFPCPEQDCDGTMFWPSRDHRAGVEQLRCSSCDLVLGAEDIALTRDSLTTHPPDVLFTTTEMLNRIATDDRLGTLVGWAGGKGPQLVLLDEVHTYQGVHGAQVGMLLRRWRHAVRAPVTFVGLSATLRDAVPFFGDLTGLREPAVDHIEPAEDDLVAEGRQYALALRADPVSQRSVLSTSIQAAMLFGRVLDRPERTPRLFGSRGFLFTDDLDVTNRFYDDLRDAEGKQPRRPGRLNGPVLAALRSPDAPQASERFHAAQAWDLVVEIGHELPADFGPRSGGQLVIGRTSSQDSGVDKAADLIVATSSLEVGLNDPQVGLVLQHKAPRDAAAFIQRRGRAGRSREMRPWTVVTLSDFGRDRLAYQSYDVLFAPDVPARRLPLGNRYVQKIQATQALLDWLGQQLREQGTPVNPRDALRAPAAGKRRHAKPGSDALAGRLARLLDESADQDALAIHLRQALQITAEDVQAILWEAPRAVLTTVVPTALRRLDSKWDPVSPDSGARPGALLSEFVTTALYEPLNVPEVRFHLPFDTRDGNTMAISPALGEAVPGRVSRRFGYQRDDHRTWLPVPQSTTTLDLEEFVASGAVEGRWTPHGTSQDLLVVRPTEITLAEPPPDISDSSKGEPRWATQIMPPAIPVAAEIPRRSAWADRVRIVEFATHAGGAAVEVRRMTYGARCEIRRTNGTTEDRQVTYQSQGQPGALGFRMAADGMHAQLSRLNLDAPRVRAYLTSASWRTLAFTTSVLEDDTLDGRVSAFNREWLVLIYLASLAMTCLERGLDTADAVSALSRGGWRSNIEEAIRALYREDGTTANGGVGQHERLIMRLSQLANDPAVHSRLDHHAELLVVDDPAGRTAHLAARVYAETVAAAVRAAVQRACPDATDRDLVVDVLPYDDAGVDELWVTETSLGGIGIVEQLIEVYGHDPRAFWGLVDASLEPGDFEYVDLAVTRFLDEVVDHPSGNLATAVERLRKAPSATAADMALRDVIGCWATLDGPPRHAAMAALSARLLRPGSDPSTDSTARALVREWRHLEERLGVEIDARVLAYAVANRGLRLDSTGPPAHLNADQIFSILWPRGYQARSVHLNHYQPYTRRPIIDRLLVGAAHEDRTPRVRVTERGWRDRYVQALCAHGAVELEADSEREDVLRAALLEVPALPVDLGFLRVYGTVRRVQRITGVSTARIEIREAEQ